MKKAVFTIIVAFVAVISLSSCEDHKKTDIVPSGTYEGVAETVNPSEREIYMRTADDKLLELYFTDNTTLTKNGETVEFSELSDGIPVEVTVEKKGKKMEPIAVKIK